MSETCEKKWKESVESIDLGNNLIKMLELVKEHLPNDECKVLDIASDKPPKFASKIAGWFPFSEVTHFKNDNIRAKKIYSKYCKIPNLKIVYTSKNLEPFYDIATGFFTLHELRNQRNVVKKILKSLKPNGKLLIIDYDLKWFPKLLKKSPEVKANAKEFFKNYIFTTQNERSVLKNEVFCIQDHTKYNLENYVGPAKKEREGLIRKKTGLRDLVYKTYPTQTPFGKKTKIFLYLGERI